VTWGGPDRLLCRAIIWEWIDPNCHLPTVTSSWFIDGMPSSVTWGGPGQMLWPGDYLGNGSTQIATYQPSTSSWFIDGMPSSVAWGGPGQIPVSAPLQYLEPWGSLSGDFLGDGETAISTYTRPPALGLYKARPVKRSEVRDKFRFPATTWGTARPNWRPTHRPPALGYTRRDQSNVRRSGTNSGSRRLPGGRPDPTATYTPSTALGLYKARPVKRSEVRDKFRFPATTWGTARPNWRPTHRPPALGLYKARPVNVRRSGTNSGSRRLPGDGQTQLATYTPSTGAWAIQARPVKRSEVRDKFRFPATTWGTARPNWRPTHRPPALGLIQGETSQTFGGPGLIPGESYAAGMAPQLSPSDAASFPMRVASTLTLNATSPLAVKYSEVGALPPGSLSPTTAMAPPRLPVQPNPGTAGNYPLIITASNGVLPDAMQNFTLTVVGMPPPSRPRWFRLQSPMVKRSSTRQRSRLLRALLPARSPLVSEP